VISPGTDLGGFVIESVAGQGGMGVVYRARQARPDRIVAVKVISSDLASDPQFRTRFQREAAIAAQIEHPNVIPVHAVGEADGTLFIAMRYVDGVDLRTLLAQQGRLEPGRAAAIVDQVAHALDAAHARGLVHRDVKPANIMIASSGGHEHVYLSDFGLSRHIVGSQALTGTGAFIGTIDYVAPEQARGERVDARADIYSLGCVLFQALTGTVPFLIDNDLAKLYAHDSHPPPSVLERAPDVPEAFESVLLRAMAKRPEERHPSAGDLGRAAVAASSGASASRPERSVAVGPAAPRSVSADDSAEAPAGVPTRPAAPAGAAQAPAGVPTRPAAPVAAAPATRAPRRRKLIAAVAGVGAVAIAAIVVAVLAGGGSGGGSSSSSESILSLVPVEAQSVPKIPDKRPLQTKAISAPGGYAYRLMLDTVNAPHGGSRNAPLPLYLTLLARRGSTPLVTVQRLQLPSQWRWTASSIVASFTLDPDPDGSGQVGLSWFVKAGDRTDVTHYLTVGPQGIQID
jgi:predicted Ser/Thr protein kinase